MTGARPTTVYCDECGRRFKDDPGGGRNLAQDKLVDHIGNAHDLFGWVRRGRPLPDGGVHS
jgi:hypothetical protein